MPLKFKARRLWRLRHQLHFIKHVSFELYTSSFWYPSVTSLSCSFHLSHIVSSTLVLLPHTFLKLTSFLFLKRLNHPLLTRKPLWPNCSAYCWAFSWSTGPEIGTFLSRHCFSHKKTAASTSCSSGFSDILHWLDSPPLYLYVFLFWWLMQE